MTLQNFEAGPPVDAAPRVEATACVDAAVCVDAGAEATAGVFAPAAWPATLAVPAESDADIWLLRVPSAWLTGTPLDDAVLDGTERRRAAAFIHPADRAGYVAAHVALRRLLGAYLGVPARSVRYRRDPCPCCGGPHGRPTLLDSSPPYFSLSHAGDLVVIGVAEVPIGVDVERRPQAHTVTAVSGLLHPCERDGIAAAAPERRAAVFTRLWARKEAYLKALGSGLGRAPNLDCTSGDPGAPPPPAGWQLVDLPVGTAHVAAAVRGTAPGRVVLRELGVEGVLAPYGAVPGHSASGSRR
ncbi:4'-phosphopantetheinyl transferase superfamily protein [Streptomyces sp. TX20-6-3]|uniref:4'-phosphopantetheinyl transferase family protein n=1 Tax=Streptomyces sp. TX20-6-3 TaxID=3028705 RepID=UPI0029AE903D|nr:4'-phosphopantetheinyl transferase superfamily protein [Streptomyces sp. TX20-6-3]MDX2561376.1 4'-phosphopantetheinyl transferase superfamily protein [Streptomyces sp. TX20-6-3]